MRVKPPGRCDSSRPGDSVAYIRKSYPYVPPWIWNSRINHHKLSVTKNRQNQQNSEVSPMFFCFPYYFTWASSVQDSCCFHVGSPFSAIVWFSLRSISLFLQIVSGIIGFNVQGTAGCAENAGIYLLATIGICLRAIT